MSPIERKVVNTVMTMIRRRRYAAAARDAAAARADLLGTHRSASLAPAKLREARFSDFEAVMDLKARWGLTADSLANWEHLWRRNPALERMNPKPPIGWVLEADDKTVGYLGNVTQFYNYCGRNLTAVAGTGFVVAPGYRTASLRLLSAFYKQDSVDLFLATTVGEVAEKLLKLFNVAPLPQTDYNTSLFWVLKPYPFVREAIKRLELNRALSTVSAPFASLAVRTDKILHRRWVRHSFQGPAIREIGLDGIGEEFQTLWTEKLKEGSRLLAHRTPASLKWHFGIPGHRGTTHVLGCFQNGKLLGYTVVRTDINQVSGLRRSIVADLLVKEDNPVIIEALLSRTYQLSESTGSHVLEVLGFPQNIRQLCLQWSPYSRRYPNFPFFFKAADPELQRTLSDGAAWFACPFDGDTTLVP
jgi:hypothetical protein